MAEGDVEQFTAAFFIDKNPPAKLLVLKRGPGFAAGLETGIGGHRNTIRDRNIQEAAENELAEEFPELAGATLNEFIRVLVNGQKALHYFWSERDSQLSIPKSGDGGRHTLEWIQAGTLDQHNIMPTAAMVLKFWAENDFSLDKTWTMYVSGNEDAGRVTRNIVVDKIVPGLEDIWPY